MKAKKAHPEVEKSTNVLTFFYRLKNNQSPGLLVTPLGGKELQEDKTKKLE